MKEEFQKLSSEIPDEKGLLQWKFPHPSQPIFLLWEPFENKIGISFRFSDGVTAPKRLPQCNGFNSNWIYHDVLDKPFSSLTLWSTFNITNDFFFSMGEDLSQRIEMIEDERERLNALLSRLHCWKKFFQKSGERSFSKEQEKGLWGELFTIITLMKRMNPVDVLELWRGYQRKNHDFIHKDWEIETKCIDSARGDITVHGLLQLEVHENKELYLHVIKVRDDNNGGMTVNDLVQEISRQIQYDPCLIEKLEEGLASSGYPPNGIRSLNTWSLVEEIWYGTIGAFPKLNGPKEIHHVEYRLPLSLYESYKKEFLKCS
ncbi:PD-(D/E)XK motif protein [Niallia oryzisoli]|uniref:PD-(D/E)XK motif protein n=1 Tax=Niallia oryzisoli TaxID=1737571 RepID=UPI0037355819